MMETEKKKALIAMSGGVDSSVAAALMLQEGYTCIGCTMKLLSGAEFRLSETEGKDSASERANTAAFKKMDSAAAKSACSEKTGTAYAAGTACSAGTETVQDVSGSHASHTCCSLEDVEDARSVARKLGMPYYVFNFTEDFGEKVIDRFVRIYQAGGTPNPCIDCNRYMKFGRLFRRAQELGCDVVVTGHYARTRFDEKSGRWQLLRVKRPDMDQGFGISQDGDGNRNSFINQVSDGPRNGVNGQNPESSHNNEKDRTLGMAQYSEKDQTYVLYAMTQVQLAHVKFPLGEYADKEKVRQIAEKYGFVNSHKPDSQDICFVPNGKYADFIERRTGKRAPCGDFVDEEGHVLGTHKGLIRYTIGQRRGLGLALPAPLYVNRIDTQKNQVILTPEDRLYSRRLIAEDFNWIWTPDWGSWRHDSAAGDNSVDQSAAGDSYAGEGAAGESTAGMKAADIPPAGYTCEVTAKPRYRAKEAEATAKVLEGGKVEIVFHEPQRALTLGQAVVLYAGENVVGGGTICEVFPPLKKGGKQE